MKKVYFIILAFATSMMFSTSVYGQSKRVPFNGLITDILGQPVKSARIYVDSPKSFSRSDRKGRFGLTNVKENDTLKIEYKKTIYLVPVAGRKSARIRLADQLNPTVEEDQQLIDMGYGYVKYRENTQPRNGITGEELRKTGYNDLLEALAGRVPGLHVTPSMLPGEEASANIRGINSINAPQTPLFIVDGVAVESLTTVNINSVDYVEILKDASIYGSRGANGAILVHTYGSK